LIAHASPANFGSVCAETKSLASASAKNEVTWWAAPVMITPSTSW
jgi:hypothetical protein